MCFEFGSPNEGEKITDIYLEARRAGNYGADCKQLYKNCPHGHGLLDLVTLIDDELLMTTKKMNIFV